jgi:hypothetical protein
MRRLPLILVLFSALLPIAKAHNGPPFPIIEGKHVGPCVIALWTHPDIGTGTFWIMIDPPSGGTIPRDLAVKLAVEPVDGRIAERTFSVTRDDSGGQLQYKALVPFDRQEFVRARVILHSAAGDGEASATVEVTPVGPGSKWEILLFLWPFLGVAFLWIRTAIRRRKGRAAAASH